jgi:hypothetical protein
MNPRIQELAEQVVGPSRLFGGEFALMGDSQVEKFATLIIQECANIALREDHDPYECILKHFGVNGNDYTD